MKPTQVDIKSGECSQQFTRHYIDTCLGQVLCMDHISASFIIWDIQTGRIVKEIKYGDTNKASFKWSLDGRKVCIIDANYSVHLYDIASGVISSPGTLQSSSKPQLWAHNTSFQVMTTGWENQALTIKISEIRSILTEIESFHVEAYEQHDRIGFFSPTTYYICILAKHHSEILDIWRSEC